MPFGRLFRSRWAALVWAGGMLWFAIDVASGSGIGPAAPPTPTDATGDAITNADLAILANAGG